MGACAHKPKPKPKQPLKKQPSKNLNFTPLQLQDWNQRFLQYKLAQKPQNIQKRLSPKPTQEWFQPLNSPSHSLHISTYNINLYSQKPQALTQEQIQDLIEQAKFNSLQQYFSLLQKQVILSVNPMAQQDFNTFLSQQRKACILQFEKKVQKLTEGLEVSLAQIQLAIDFIKESCNLSNDYYIFFNNLHSFEQISLLKQELIEEGLFKQLKNPKQLLEEYQLRAVGFFVQRGKLELQEILKVVQSEKGQKKNIARKMLIQQNSKQREFLNRESDVIENNFVDISGKREYKGIFQKVPSIALQKEQNISLVEEGKSNKYINKQKSFGKWNIQTIQRLDQTHQQQEEASQQFKEKKIDYFRDSKEVLQIQYRNRDQQTSFHFQQEQFEINQNILLSDSIKSSEITSSDISSGNFIKPSFSPSNFQSKNLSNKANFPPPPPLPLGQFPPPPPLPLGQFPPPPPVPLGQFPPPPPLPLGQFPPPPPLPLGQFPPPPPLPLNHFPKPPSNPLLKLQSLPLQNFSASEFSNKPELTVQNQQNQQEEKKTPPKPSAQQLLMQQLRSRLQKRSKSPQDIQNHLKEQMQKRFEQIHAPSIGPLRSYSDSKIIRSSSSSESSIC